MNTERVTTHELATGDTVLTHGMLVLLGERGERMSRAGDEMRLCVWFAGTVLNPEEVNADLIPVSFRTAEGYAPGTHWQVQGNDLAYWHRVVK